MTMQKNKGILTVVSGFFRCGKRYDHEGAHAGTQRDLRALDFRRRAHREPGSATVSSIFSRAAKRLRQMIADDALVEYAEYVGNYYGTPKAYVEEQLARGKDVILEIEIRGALKVRRQFPDALLLFVTPPSAEVLKNRLIGRGTETMDVIEHRLARALEEAEGLENTTIW